MTAATALRRSTRLAPVALLPLAAFAVHQLRYMLAFGWNDGAELRMTGHSYLHSVVPWLVLLLALVAGGFLLAIGRALAGHRTVSRYAVSLTGLWLLCSATLVGIFACQEYLEGLFATVTRPGWRGSSATAAGGRSRRTVRRADPRLPVPRRAVGARRGRQAARAPTLRQGLPDRAARPAARRRCRGWRRWPTAGQAADLLGELNAPRATRNLGALAAALFSTAISVADTRGIARRRRPPPRRSMNTTSRAFGRRPVQTIAIAIAIMLISPALASAHARVSPAVSLAGKLQLYSLAVPTEKNGLATTKIVMTVPTASGSTRSCRRRRAGR